MNQIARIRPNLWQCLWAIPFVVTGGGMFGYILIHGLIHITDSLTQIVVPGSAELSLRPGEYSVFLEEDSTVNGKIYSTTQSVNGLTCHIRALQSGTSIAMTRSSANITYSVNGRSGHSVLEFPIQQAGKYTVACNYDGGTKGPEVVVAVGSGVGSAISLMVLKSLSALFGGCGAGLVVVLVVVLKREREKKRLRQSAQLSI